MSTFAHHGIIYVPLGYARAFGQLTNLAEVHGGEIRVKSFLFASVLTNFDLIGSPWGAGTYAASDGSRQPTALELEIATIQGKEFYTTVSKVKFE